jgi:hypothetical protein
VCNFYSDSSVPSEFASTSADRSLYSFLQNLADNKNLPTFGCAKAYANFRCSVAYPECVGDADSGFGKAVPACQHACNSFVTACAGELPEVGRDVCTQFESGSPCTSRRRSDLSAFYQHSGAAQLAAGAFFVLAALFALAF